MKQLLRQCQYGQVLSDEADKSAGCIVHLVAALASLIGRFLLKSCLSAGERT